VNPQRHPFELLCRDLGLLRRIALAVFWFLQITGRTEAVDESSTTSRNVDNSSRMLLGRCLRLA
jgi:hypothetical protein